MKLSSFPEEKKKQRKRSLSGESMCEDQIEKPKKKKPKIPRSGFCVWDEENGIGIFFCFVFFFWDKFQQV